MAVRTAALGWRQRGQRHWVGGSKGGGVGVGSNKGGSLVLSENGDGLGRRRIRETTSARALEE